MRRVLTAAAALLLAGLLAGCSALLPTLLPFLPQPQPVSSPAPPPPDDTDPAEPASGPLAVGSCLDGTNGYDSDREELVGCAGPHLFDVVAIEEWPGMTAALATDDPGDVYDELYSEGGGADYWQWGSTTCAAAVRGVLGIDDVTVDGHTAAEMWLRIAGIYGVDISLASREAFVAGDHTTVCSAAWYHIQSRPSRITYPDGLGFADLLDPAFGPDWRECRTVDYFTADCAQDHWGQTLAGFEGIDVFGADLIARVADGTATDADWMAADAFCEHLLDATLPPTANPEGLLRYADVGAGNGWDSYDGSVDPAGGYVFDCIATAPFDEQLLAGDVIAGSATVVTS